MRLADLAVGADGRNRTILSAFRSRTGRNQPSQLEVHLRPDRVAARTDQAASRSRHRLHRLEPAGIRHRGRPVGRPAMKAAYRSGDPIWHSLNRPVPSPQTLPRTPTRVSASCASNASWASSTEWRIGALPYASISRASLPVIYCRLTENLSDVLALVRCRRRLRHAHWLAAHRIRVACARR